MKPERPKLRRNYIVTEDLEKKGWRIEKARGEEKLVEKNNQIMKFRTT